MGTNYYLETDFCPCCGKPKTTIHPGKASWGHRFLFEYQNGIKTDNRPENLQVLIRSEHIKLHKLNAKRGNNGKFKI